jgi:4-amino-4-deoxy-L-arabinose transferase-like glycosyltransferase
VRKPTNQADASQTRDLLLIILLFGLIAGLGLGSYSLGNPDEGRYAEIPREMVATGDYVTPRLDGVNYFEKPPLVYWCVAGCLKLFGPSEWSMRITPVLFALGGILAVYLAARRLYGRDAGLVSASVLGTSLLYVALARILLLDMAVAVLISAALLFFIVGINEPVGTRRRWFFYGLYASAALATLAKGLIGFLLPGAVMFLWLLLCNEWRRLRPFYLPTGILLFLAIALPWHVLAAQRNPTWAHFYFVREHWERFTTTEHGRYEPFWFFIPIVLFGFFPWTEIAWHALRDGLRSGWKRRRENSEFWFFVIWAAFVFLFFSKSQSKLIPYILPVLPPLAIISGKWLALRFKPEAAAERHPRFRIFSAVALVLGIGLCVVMTKPDLVHMRSTQAIGLKPYGFVMAAIFITAAVAVPWLGRARGTRVAVGGLVATMMLFLGTLVLAAPHLQKPGTKELALIVKARAAPEDRIYHYGGFYHDFVFYSGRLVGLVNYKDELEPENDPNASHRGRFIDIPEFRRQWADAARIWIVVHNDQAKSLFDDPSFRYHLIAQSEKHYLLSNRP